MIFETYFYLFFTLTFGSIWLHVNCLHTKHIFVSEYEEEKKKDDIVTRVVIYSNDDKLNKDFETSLLNENTTFDINIDINFDEDSIKILIIEIRLRNMNSNENNKIYGKIYEKYFKLNDILPDFFSILNSANMMRNGIFEDNNILKNCINLLNLKIDFGKNTKYFVKHEEPKKDKIAGELSLNLQNLLNSLNSTIDMPYNEDKLNFKNSSSYLTSLINALQTSTVSNKDTESSTKTSDNFMLFSVNSTQSSYSHVPISNSLKTNSLSNSTYTTHRDLTNISNTPNVKITESTTSLKTNSNDVFNSTFYSTYRESTSSSLNTNFDNESNSRYYTLRELTTESTTLNVANFQSTSSNNLNNFSTSTFSIHRDVTEANSILNSESTVSTTDLSINLTNWLDEQIKLENDKTVKPTDKFETNHSIANIAENTTSYVPQVAVSNLDNEDSSSDTEAFFRKRGIS